MFHSCIFFYLSKKGLIDFLFMKSRKSILCLFVCLFVKGFSSHSRIFYSYGYVTITGERLQILTYARHLSPLSSMVLLAGHTYSDTGHPFIMIISKDPWNSYLLPRVLQCSCNYLLRGLPRLGFEHQTFRLRCERFR